MSIRKSSKSLFVQGVVAALSQVFVYKILVLKAGADQVGTWALILGVANFIGLAGFGISTGVVKMISSTLPDDKKAHNSIIASALLLTLGINIFLFGLIYYGGGKYMHATLGTAYSAVMKKAFVCTLISLVINSIASIVLAVLDGKHQFTSRVQIVCLGYLLYVISSYFFIDFLGVIGIAYGFLLQTSVVLVMGILFMWYNRIISLKDFVLSKVNLQVLWRYGYSLQIINVLMFFFDPLTKYFLINGAGLSAVGYYEMANRLVMQVRNLLGTTSQVIVPNITSPGKTTGDLKKFLTDFFYQHINIATCAALTLAASGWLISLAWLGEVNQVFLLALLCANLGWFVNTISVPAFYYFLGKGKVIPNILQHLSYAVVAFLLFMVLPISRTSPIGYLIPAIALMAGSFYLLVKFCKSLKMHIWSLFTVNQQKVIGLLALFTGIYLPVVAEINAIHFSILFSMVMFALLLYFFVQQQLLGVVKSFLSFK